MKRILVIDDDEAVRSAFEVALPSSQFELQTVANGAAALESLARRRADLIFLDLNMPESTGIDVLRWIRDEDRSTPVFIVTAFAEEFMAALRRAAAEGLHFNLLRKPLDVDEIQAAACAVLSESGKEEETSPC